MSKDSGRSSVMETLLSAAAGLLVLVVILWVIVWIISKIWLWIVLGVIAVLVVFAAVRYIRWRRQW